MVFYSAHCFHTRNSQNYKLGRKNVAKETVFVLSMRTNANSLDPNYMPQNATSD